MRGRGTLTTLLAGLLLAAAQSGAQAGEKKAPPAEAHKPVVWALLLGGSQGEPVYGRNMADWVARMHALLTKEWKADPSRVLVLAEKHEKVPALPPAEAPTIENIRKAFETLKQSVKAGDRFVLFVAGHGETNEPVGKLTLPGADLRADDLAGWLDGLASQNIVVLHCAGAGGEFQQRINRKGRVVICASGKLGEGNECFFAEFLLRAYETKLADENKDGKVTLLEMFNWASHETANWYHRQYKTDDGWRVAGKNTRAIWKKIYEGGDKKLDAPANPDDADAEPVWGKEPNEEWLNRRILAEHASLDDLGEQGGSVTWINNEFQPLTGKESNAQGKVARRVLLGQPELLPDSEGGAP